MGILVHNLFQKSLGLLSNNQIQKTGVGAANQGDTTRPASNVER